MHSQRLSDVPLSPWIIIQPDGKVLAAHCNCMAGLGEACTHVAALLYSIEASVTDLCLKHKTNNNILING